ncbi:hypothetical protein AAZX31_10G094700 [Glycine max]
MGMPQFKAEEDKQRAKIKEKIDKFVKEKLLDFCDVLNIQINKTNVKKEEGSTKLLEYLESPHATTKILLADKEQKGKKRTRKSFPSKSPGKASTETPAKVFLIFPCLDLIRIFFLDLAWFRELPTGVLDPLSLEQVMQSQSEEECAQLMRLLPPSFARAGDAIPVRRRMCSAYEASSSNRSYFARLGNKLNGKCCSNGKLEQHECT